MTVTIDTHTHSRFSLDADRDLTLSRLCGAAVRRGLTCVAVTDHYDLTPARPSVPDSGEAGTYPPCPFIPLTFEPALREKELAEAREAYAGKLTILRGIELGEMTADPAEAERVLSEAPFDVVLGSLHAIRGKGDFYDMPYGELSDAELFARWEQYLAELYEMVSFGKMSVLAHIRYPEQYFLAAGRGALLDIEKRGREYFEPVFRKLVERGILLEVNTAILRRTGREPDPGLELLQFYRELGGKKVAVGSDAHSAEDCGAGFAEAGALIEAAGLKPVSDCVELLLYKD